MAAKKAAIITPYGLFNYGNRLQNYAVHRTLEKSGYKTETLIIRRPFLTRQLLDLGLKFGHSMGLKGAESAKFRSFLRFDRAMQKKRVWSESDLSQIEAHYDVIIFGSDQIWNPHQIDLGGAEYGSFASNTRKVALSASFGVDKLPKEVASKLARRLSDFHAVSVREFAGQGIIYELTGNSVPVLVDPTMSIGVAEWRQIASRARKPRSPYLLVYLLGDQYEDKRKLIARYAEDKGLEVVTLMNREERPFYSSGPDDFLGLIDGANEVISDSFHAAVFSLMFKTDFSLVRRADRNSMASRFSTLAAHFDLEFHRDTEWPWEAMRVGEATDFDEKLERAREEYFEYVYRALANP